MDFEVLDEEQSREFEKTCKAMYDEIFDLKNYSLDQKAKLVEFRLGYNKKGYTNFCKRCRGFSTANTLKVKPAVQGG